MYAHCVGYSDRFLLFVNSFRPVCLNSQDDCEQFSSVVSCFHLPVLRSGVWPWCFMERCGGFLRVDL